MRLSSTIVTQRRHPNRSTPPSTCLTRVQAGAPSSRADRALGAAARVRAATCGRVSRPGRGNPARPRTPIHSVSLIPDASETRSRNALLEIMMSHAGSKQHFRNLLFPLLVVPRPPGATFFAAAAANVHRERLLRGHLRLRRRLLPDAAPSGDRWKSCAGSIIITWSPGCVGSLHSHRPVRITSLRNEHASNLHEDAP